MTFEKKAAAIDLGTNTAHILIAENDHGHLNILDRKRHYVFLAEEGIENIGNNAQKRLFCALDDFYERINEKDIKVVLATATEAFRKAKNGNQILDQVISKYGWEPKIISGNREADLIYRGVKSYINFEEGAFLIMDIGGGSVELIVVENDRLIWKESFPIGIAALYHRSDNKDPMNHQDMEELKSYIRHILSPLKMYIDRFPQVQLIGAAGSFEILTSNRSRIEKDGVYINTSEIHQYMEELKGLDEQKRAELTWMPVERAKYVVLAILLIEVVLEYTENQKIGVSPYALKEGLLAEYFNF